MNLEIGQIRLLVSMATDRVIMGKNGVATFSQLLSIRSFSYLHVMLKCMRARRGSNFCQNRLQTAELASLKRLKKTQRLIMGKLVLPRFLTYS